ncbi:MAG: hypothetical protein AB7J40_03300 [Candidatus Altimarinota bacterium]
MELHLQVDKVEISSSVCLELSQHPEIKSMMDRVTQTQIEASLPVMKLLQGIGSDVNHLSFKSLQTPKFLEHKGSEGKHHQFHLVNKQMESYEISALEKQLMALFQEWSDINGQLSDAKKQQKLKKEKIQASHQRLGKILRALESKRLPEIQVSDLVADRFLEVLAQKKPELPLEEQEEWETVLMKIWEQHEHDLPELIADMEAEKELLSEEEWQAFSMTEARKTTLKGQMSLLGRPENYETTVELMKLTMESEIKRLKKLALSKNLSLTSSERNHEDLYELLKMDIVCQTRSATAQVITPSPSSSSSTSDTPTNRNNSRWTIAAGVAAALIVGAVSQLKNETILRTDPQNPPALPPLPRQQTPAPQKTPNSSTAFDLLYPDMSNPISATTPLRAAASSPLSSTIEDLNRELQQLRKVSEWKPFKEPHGRLVLFFASWDLEDIRRSFTELRQVSGNDLRVFSLTCTDGSKHPDGREGLYDAAFEIAVGNTHYLFFRRQTNQGEMFFICELGSDGQTNNLQIVPSVTNSSGIGSDPTTSTLEAVCEQLLRKKTR